MAYNAAVDLIERNLPERAGKTAFIREIALLVAEGKSNRAIADALGIAAKTVEQHLSSAFSKLQLSSRTQLATALMRDGAQAHERAT
jgi:DNA-binding NarL/FixJ family response regulator